MFTVFVFGNKHRVLLVWVERSGNILQMGHHVRDMAGRKLFPPTGRISILSVLRRVRHSTVHVTKGQKNREGERERERGSRWIVHRGYEGEQKTSTFVSHVCTHTHTHNQTCN